MLTTYKAILRGDRLEWSSNAPAPLKPDQAVAVHVTILDEVIEPETLLAQGERMAAALAKLAALEIRAESIEPLAWERELRQDRVLPERDH